MVSLWGSKKNSGDQQQQQLSHQDQPADDTDNTDNTDNTNNMPRRSEDDHREPTERDRLLPREQNRPRQDGYLDPDDPAVRPYTSLLPLPSPLA